MKLKTNKTTVMLKNANNKSQIIFDIAEGSEVKIADKKFHKDGSTWYVKVKYNNTFGYIDSKYVNGLVKKVKNKTSKKYPKVAVITNGTKLKVPNQKMFGTYLSNHGCSMIAVNIMLQFFGKKKAPRKIENYCKKNISGYNGSKLAIYGAYKAVKQITGMSERLVFKTVKKANKSDIRDAIKNQLRNGSIIAVEQKNPIHTYVIIGYNINGKLMVATNGTVQQKTLNWVMETILTGTNKHTDWFKGSQYDGGIIVCKK